MKAILITATIALVITLVGGNATGNSAVDYNQSGANWKDEMCIKGLKQSPIDIPSIDGQQS